MDKERRQFIKMMIFGFGAVVLGGLIPLKQTIQTLPKRIIRAFKPLQYPGGIKPFSEKEVLKKGHWKG